MTTSPDLTTLLTQLGELTAAIVAAVEENDSTDATALSMAEHLNQLAYDLECQITGKGEG